MPTAYSYIRFSHPSQAKGDRRNRQTKAARAWCDRHNAALKPDERNQRVTLDDSLKPDMGVSAYKGRHRKDDKNNLAAFLKLVGEGRIAPGSYLIVENLDRLTREEIWDALELVIGIINRGIRIVQLTPVEIVYDKSNANPLQVIVMITELMRGNSQSAEKSIGIGAAWDKKREAARKKQMQPPRKVGGRITKAMTGWLLAWIAEVDGEMVLQPERAKVVRRIFEMATGDGLKGAGLRAIVKKLTEDGVPAMGRSKYKHWTPSYIRNILRDRRAVGEIQLRREDGTLNGDPIKGYCPAAVTETEFQAAQQCIQLRKRKRGKVSPMPNIFSHLVRNARDGSAYTLMTRANKQRALVNLNGSQGRGKVHTFPLDVFEKSMLLVLLRFIPARDIVGGQDPDYDRILEGRRDALEAKKKGLIAALDAVGGEIETARKLKEVAAELDRVTEEMARLNLGGPGQRMKALDELKASEEDLQQWLSDPDLRLRLQSCVRALVSEIWCVFGGKGRDRVGVAQMVVASQKDRDASVHTFVIRIRHPKQTLVGRTPGFWSVVVAEDPSNPDLRTPKGAETAVDWVTHPETLGGGLRFDSVDYHYEAIP